MMAGKFDLQAFFGRPEHVGLAVVASELFGLLRRALDLPADWAGLVTRKRGDHSLVPAGGMVPGADADDLFFVRVSPIDLTISEDGIVARDKYQCRVDVRLRISVIPEASEVLSFRKTILGSRRVAKTEAIERYLQPALRTALSKLADEHDALELVGGDLMETVSAALADALQGPCFAAGLAIEDRPTARFDSPTLHEVQETEQEAARRRADHEAARGLQVALEQSQAQHLDHLTSLLARLKEMASASPDAELPQLLRTFSEHQRGELYEALFASATPVSKTRWIVVAAGDELLYFDPQNPDAPVRRLTITGAVGPVRSVRTVGVGRGEATLLLGAATGVCRLPIERAEPEVTLSVSDAPPVRGGFNAAAMVGGRVFASHSELGLWEWDLNEPGAGKARFDSMTRNARAVRGVLFLDGDLYCSIDDRIIRWPADDTTDRPAQVYTGSESTIASLCATPEGLFAGNSRGDILLWPGGRDDDPEYLHRGTERAAESVWLLSTHGVRRLVFTDTSLSVHARVLGDNFTCRYEAGGQTLRRVEVAPDLIVATNELRDRLLVWDPTQPARPQATIAVSRMCGQSVQDVCLAPVA